MEYKNYALAGTPIVLVCGEEKRGEELFNSPPDQNQFGTCVSVSNEDEPLRPYFNLKSILKDHCAL